MEISVSNHKYLLVRSSLANLIDSAVSCTIGTCMLFKSATVNLAGCCTGFDRQNCGWASSCVDASRYSAGSCGASCILDPLVRKCTDTRAPYCVTWTYPSDGVSDYGCGATSRNSVSTVRQTASGTGLTSSIRLSTVAANILAASSTRRFTFPTSSIVYSGGGGSGSTTYDYPRARKTLAIGTIIGIVVAVLGLLFFVAIGIFMCIKKKKKNKQIANNAQIIANNQATFDQQQQQQGQFTQQGPQPPMSPAPSNTGYFAPPPQNAGEQKYNPHASVSEYNMTPISNPGSPPPPQYTQPYGAPPQQQQQYQYNANGAHEVAAPVPQQSTSPAPQQQQYQYVASGAHEVAAPVPQQSVSPVQQQQNNLPMQSTGPAATGAHEVDAISVPNAPGRTGPLYEMGGR